MFSKICSLVFGALVKSRCFVCPRVMQPWLEHLPQEVTHCSRLFNMLDSVNIWYQNCSQCFPNALSLYQITDCHNVQCDSKYAIWRYLKQSHALKIPKAGWHYSSQSPGKIQNHRCSTQNSDSPKLSPHLDSDKSLFYHQLQSC